jgi:hypothetical protein
MNAQQFDYALEGRMAAAFDLSGQEITGNETEQDLIDLGLQEQQLPPETVQAMHAYANKLKKQGKRNRAVKREVTRKFNIQILK